MIVVADASPLIALARIGRLEVLAGLYGRVEIPPAVRQEVTRRAEFANRLPPWLHVRAPTNTRLVVSLGAEIDPGEAEAVALAVELRALLLIDELDGRRVARAQGLNIVGTLGVLIRATTAWRNSSIRSSTRLGLPGRSSCRKPA